MTVEEPKRAGDEGVVLCDSYAPLDGYEVISEVCPRLQFEDPDGTARGGPPAIVISQHRGTKELRIDVHGCMGGLDLGFITGTGLMPKERKRSRLVRAVRTTQGDMRELTVRFLANGEASNLVVKV